MSANKYIRAWIDRQEIDLYPPETNPVSINYKLEDAEDFQVKTSSDALDQTFPATPNNDKNFNTFHNPGIEDFTPNQTYRSVRPGLISVRGYEVIVGKWLLVSASHGSCPIEYQADLYGNNADWIIALKDSTMYDFLKQINFTFTTANIINSWSFDGTNEALPYVYAPVRYGGAMNGLAGATYPADLTDVTLDINCTADYLKPSISPYWIIYWAFKSLGYRVRSNFMDNNYFRRLVMPWTWGSFLVTDGTRLDQLKFLAKSASQAGYWFKNDYTGLVDLNVTNNSTDGAFDNGIVAGAPVYSYDAVNKKMNWTYPVTTDFGTLQSTFRCQVNYNATVRGGALCASSVRWYKNGVEDLTQIQSLFKPIAVNSIIGVAGIGRADAAGISESFATFTVSPGDIISCAVGIELQKTGFTGSGNIILNVVGFDYEYSTIPQGGLIDFQNYTAWQNYNFLDLLRGITDFFNLIVQTDPINKIVYFEPEFPFSIGNNLGAKSGGYFNGNFLNWDRKQDLKQKSTIALFSDYSRQLNYTLRDDSADGMLKLMQDRYTTTLGLGIYVLPDRFQTDVKQIQNRFFSPVMHYLVSQWQYIDGGAPQMIVMAPENVSNTSASAAQNTFQPKLAWYKGNVTGAGGWMFEKSESTHYPFMFAVNYNDEGIDDPILSYSDEKIGYVFPQVGKGLLKRFYWQRMAIIRNGQYYTTWMKLNNLDAMNWLHREFIICRGQRWQLVEINNYTPTVEKSTSVLMRKFVAISPVDDANTYPSADNVMNGTVSASGYETKYYPLMAFASDIPTPKAPVDTKGSAIPAPLQISFSTNPISEISFELIFSASMTVYVDWGDGDTPETFTGNDINFDHDYLTAGSYTVNIYFENPENLLRAYLSRNNIVSVSSFAPFENLVWIELSVNDLPSYDTLFVPAGIHFLDLEENLIPTFDPSGLPIGTEFFYIGHFAMTSFDASLLPSTINTFYINSAGLSSICSSTLPANLSQFSCEVNTLTEDQINNLLIQLDTNGLSGGSCNTSSQSPAMPPSGAGITAKNNLIAKGWSVITD